VAVTNSGKVAGAEVVQLYVAPRQGSVLRPVRELKGFSKVFLAPGETKMVSLALDRRAFAFWSTDGGAWIVESGPFDIEVGSSSRDLRRRATVEVTVVHQVRRVWDQNACLVQLKNHPVGSQFYQMALPRFLSMFGSVGADDPAALMMEAMISEMPLRNLVRMGGGQFTEEQLEDLLLQLNAT